jgi:hypothetical protein
LVQILQQRSLKIVYVVAVFCTFIHSDAVNLGRLAYLKKYIPDVQTKGT